MLHVENTSQIGFFVYSTREMDADSLSDEIEYMLGVKLGIMWKTIDIGKRNLPENENIKALIVEVNATKGMYVKNIYSILL